MAGRSSRAGWRLRCSPGSTALVPRERAEGTVLRLPLPGLPNDALGFIGEMTEIPRWQFIVLDVGWAPGLFLDTLIYIELAEEGIPAMSCSGSRSLSGVQGTDHGRERLSGSITERL